MRKTIVELKGYCLKPFCLVMEYLPNGSLYDYLRKNKGILYSYTVGLAIVLILFLLLISDIPWVIKLKIAANIADALYFLHTQTPKILHRDLKSPNVLVSIS